MELLYRTPYTFANFLFYLSHPRIPVLGIRPGIYGVSPEQLHKRGVNHSPFTCQPQR